MITLAQVFATVLLLLAVSGELPRLRAPRPLLRAWVLVRPFRAGFVCMVVACAWRVALKHVALGAARASELCIRDGSVLSAHPRAVLLPCAVCSVRLQIMCLVFAHVVCSAVSTLPRSVSSATDRIVLVHVHASQSLSMRRTRPVLHRCNSRRIPTPFRSCVMMSQRASMGTAIRRPSKRCAPF